MHHYLLRGDDEKRLFRSALVNIGFGNVVTASKVVAIVTPGSAPMKRLREEARKQGKLVDATEGRRAPFHNSYRQRPYYTQRPAG